MNVRRGKMDEDKKPEGLISPQWYFHRWQVPYDWKFYFGKVYGRYVFNCRLPWFEFGYAW